MATNDQTSAFTVIDSEPTIAEADLMVEHLRSNGFHPPDIAPTHHMLYAGSELTYPIEVPTEEAEAAREFVHSIKG